MQLDPEAVQGRHDGLDLVLVIGDSDPNQKDICRQNHRHGKGAQATTLALRFVVQIEQGSNGAEQHHGIIHVGDRYVAPGWMPYVGFFPADGESGKAEHGCQPGKAMAAVASTLGAGIEIPVIADRADENGTAHPVEHCCALENIAQQKAVGGSITSHVETNAGSRDDENGEKQAAERRPVPTKPEESGVPDP